MLNIQTTISKQWDVLGCHPIMCFTCWRSDWRHKNTQKSNKRRWLQTCQIIFSLTSANSFHFHSVFKWQLWNYGKCSTSRDNMNWTQLNQAVLDVESRPSLSHTDAQGLSDMHQAFNCSTANPPVMLTARWRGVKSENVRVWRSSGCLDGSDTGLAPRSRQKSTVTYFNLRTYLSLGNILHICITTYVMCLTCTMWVSILILTQSWFLR